MTWEFERKPYKVYQRNPLNSTHVEIRFFPLLKVETEYASFQDAVRTELPRYELNKVHQVQLNPQAGAIQVNEKEEHSFVDPSGHHRLVLSTESLAYSSIEHKSKEELLGYVSLGLSALENVFGKFQTTRLGVRYVNIIDKQKISDEIGELCEWDDLISEEYISHPHQIANLEATNFHTQIRSNMDNNGMLGLQYGLTQANEGTPEHFRFDIDRYIEQPSEDIPELIEQFTQDIYSLFQTLVSDRLIQWMEKSN